MEEDVSSLLHASWLPLDGLDHATDSPTLQIVV